MTYTKTPTYLKSIFKGMIWDLPEKENILYLTFDDGPSGIQTDFILDTLDQYEAKATFFCLGKQIDAHPELFQDIQRRGHSVGNHSYHHLNGWRTDNDVYYDDVAQCQKLVGTSLFRPPFGKIKISQINKLKKDYKIIMWDILSGDWDEELSTEECLNNILDYARHGSIIVMHDNEKSVEKMKYILPYILKHYTEKGFRFQKIQQEHAVY